jgi:hypothetical protein
MAPLRASTLLAALASVAIVACCGNDVGCSSWLVIKFPEPPVTSVSVELYWDGRLSEEHSCKPYVRCSSGLRFYAISDRELEATFRVTSLVGARSK